MNCLSQVYRQACREIDLPAAEKKLFLRLLRELSVNAVIRRKAWHIKEDFVTLWFISAGRFPELAASPYGMIISAWITKTLPFELNKGEQVLLWD
jgi:hypothetical protein